MMSTFTSGHNCVLGSLRRASPSCCVTWATPPGISISLRIAEDAIVSGGAWPGVLIRVVTNQSTMVLGKSGWRWNKSVPWLPVAGTLLALEVSYQSHGAFGSL